MSRLPALPRDDVYEIWVERDGALEPSSLFVPRRDGSAGLALGSGVDADGGYDDADASVVVDGESRRRASDSGHGLRDGERAGSI